MSLQNLAKIGLLVEHDTDKRQVGKLMEAAERFVEDARQETISLETRLDAAYNAIDYTGEVVDPGSVTTCIEATVFLQGCLESWLSENRPDLLGR